MSLLEGFAVQHNAALPTHFTFAIEYAQSFHKTKLSPDKLIYGARWENNNPRIKIKQKNECIAVSFTKSREHTIDTNTVYPTPLI